MIRDLRAARHMPVAVALLVVTGCLPHRLKDPDENHGVAPPAAYSTAGAERVHSAAKGPDTPWWTSFDDAELTRLVELALGSNLDLRATWSRLRQADALATQAKAGRWFRVDAQGGVSYQGRPNTFGDGTSKTTSVSASLPVSYEVDLFARYRAQGQAAELEMEATRGSMEAAAMSLSAQTAEAWYALVEARARNELLQEQLELSETFLELVLLRFEQGLTSALDVHQQRQQVVGTRAQLELVKAQELVVASRLAVLAGKEPGAWAPPAGAVLPSPPPLSDAGVPADLLELRPDVRAAKRRVQAADQRVGAAIAARLPSLRVGVAPGYLWSRADRGSIAIPIPETTSGFTWTVEAGLLVPLFDGGLRKGEVSLRRAQLDEALATYGQTLRLAVAEVENALVQERQQRAHITHLEQQVEVAGQTLDAARDRYRQGLSDFLPVLTAIVSRQQAELTLLAARRQLLSYRIQLHRALGGTWTKDLVEPSEAAP